LALLCRENVIEIAYLIEINISICKTKDAGCLIAAKKNRSLKG